VELLFARSRVTAVFAHNDDLALGVRQFLRERGLDCPGDVGVAGYNDTFLGSHITPALTTVRWPVEEVGPCVAELALSAVAGQPNSGPELVSVGARARRARVDRFTADFRGNKVAR
jgi:DNA-binding LacI/PurR family transcriptional regulator